MTRPAERGRAAWLLTVLVVFAALVLRIANLDAQSLWFDEGWSWHLAGLPLGEMAGVTAGDRSPFLYYALLHAWLRLAGDAEFAMRFLSLAADVTTVALVMALSRSLAVGRESPGGLAELSPVLAGAVYALSPFAVWYAQETRMYALVSTLCLASSYWLLRWLRRPRWKRALLASAALLLAAIYCHYYAVFLLPAHGALVVLAWAEGKRREAGGKRGETRARVLAWWCVAAGAVVVATVPWLVFASRGFAYDDGFVFPLNAVPLRLGEWVSAFANGGLPLPLPGGWAVGLGAAVVLSSLTFLLGRRWREWVFLAVLVIVPLLAAAIAVRLFYPYRSVFHPRYLIYVLPPVCVLLGGAIAPRNGAPRVSKWLSAGMASASIVVVGGLWLPSLYAIYADPAVARDDVRAAARHVVEALQPGDLVIMARDNYALRYYYPRAISRHPVTDTHLLAIPEGLHGVLRDDTPVVDALNTFRPKRVRLFLWQDDVVDPQRLVESSLWPNGYQVGEYNFGRIRLPLYQVQTQPAAALTWTPVAAQFGDQLELAGYWKLPENFAGDWFYTVLQWKPLRPLDADYKAYVHVVDRDGQVRFQRDKLPLNDLLPMTSWATGQPLRDAYALVSPADLQPGEYRVVAGIYDPATGDRLPIQSGSMAPANEVDLGTLLVKRR